MRRSALLCCAILLVGCAKADTAADSTMAVDSAIPAATMEPAPISLQQVAGKWDVRIMAETGDSTLTTYVLDAKPDTAGWSFTFPNRAPIPMQVNAVAGDSIMTEAGPFDSQLQKGVKVHSVVTWRLQDGRLMGTIVSHYETKPPSTRNLRAEGTRQ